MAPAFCANGTRADQRPCTPALRGRPYAVSAALKAKVPSPKQIDTAGPSSAGPLWHSHRRSRPDPRSQQLQTIACWRQPAHKNRRPDSGSGRPVSQTQRGRTPSLAGYSSCMRARHDVGTAPTLNLQVARGAVLASKLWQALAAPSSRGPQVTTVRRRRLEPATAVQRLIRSHGRVFTPAAMPPGGARRRLRALPHRR